MNRSFYIAALKKIESIQRNLPEFLEIISDMLLIKCKNALLSKEEIKMIAEIINP